MKALKKIKPYTDDKLTWDESSQQYYLTIEYCKNQFDNTFRDDEVLKRRIKKNSRKIYNWIKYHINSYNKPVVESVLNKTQEGRNFILEMLTIQMEADVETGFNDLSSTPAINVNNGQVLDRNELWRNQICVDAEQLFNTSDQYFGFRLGYQCPYPYSFFTFFR